MASHNDGESTDAHMRSFDPQAIDGYQITQELGRGSIGSVYRAVQISMQREVALKVLHPDLSANSEFTNRFRHEAQMAGAVQHQNVITSYDAGESQGFLFQALELIDGGDVFNLVKEQAVNEKDAISIILDCANGLEGIHSAGLAHCDINPSNIFISGDGVAKLGDLGLTRSLHAEGTRSYPGTVPEYHAFVAPESQDLGSLRDIRSDIYSLGAVLFYLLTDNQPFNPESSEEQGWVDDDDQPNDPRTIDPDLSTGVAAVVLRSMAMDPADRYQNPTELREDLERISYNFAPLHARMSDAIATDTNIARRATSSSASSDSEIRQYKPDPVTSPALEKQSRQPKQTPAKKKSKAAPFVIVLILVLLAGGGAFFVMTSDNDFLNIKPDNKASTTREMPLSSIEKTPAEPQLVIKNDSAPMPSWASNAGEDEFGRWATLKAGHASYRLRLIPPGTFTMGIGSKASMPHEVTISKAFWMGETEMPQAFFEATSGENPSHFRQSDRPVESISFKQVNDFLDVLKAAHAGASFRLPTEAEWEYTSWANSKELTQCWHSGNSNKETHTLKQLPPNAFGMYGMLGNVMEWVADAYSSLSGDAATDPMVKKGLFRTAKGGAWSVPLELCHPGHRSKYQPQTAFFFLGFRIAIDDDGTL